MKIALISDIHANYEALKAVEKHFRNLVNCEDQKEFEKRLGVDKDIAFWFLGDAVGRGPYPLEVLGWIRKHVHEVDENYWVVGNHEAMMMKDINNIELSLINQLEISTAQKHFEILETDESLKNFIDEQYTKERKSIKHHLLAGKEYILAHSGFYDPLGLSHYNEPWDTYSFVPEELNWLAENANDHQRIMVFGHTHLSTLISGSTDNGSIHPESEMVEFFKPYDLSKRKLWMINPGSVGSPRDTDNRAAYAVLDINSNQVTFYKVAYDWRITIREMTRKRYSANLKRRIRDAPASSRTPKAWKDHFLSMKNVVE
ncbi:MAG: metallophosphoesterase [Anaerolineaceae bacterium]|nr:metallophosphoesterase [Anaerolineaceae bacterium]